MEKLKPGDKIGIFSPSSPVTATAPKRFARAKAFLESKGFIIVEGSLTGKSDHYRSGTIKERVGELNALIKNPEVKCIMATIGGMNSNSMLPYIDYDALKKNPKPIIGYSDVTAILLGVYAKTGITTYYGPAFVPSFGEFEPFVNDTFEYFQDILITPNYPHELKKPKFWSDERLNWETFEKPKEQRPSHWQTVIPGLAAGRLMGGNLNTIGGIWGSPYMPKFLKGDILFIEDCLKDAATLERAFSFLKINGVFDLVAGIILGKHELFNDLGTGRRPQDILLEVLSDQDLPFLADFDCSHTHPMLTLPIGSFIELDATNQKVTVLKESC